LPQAGEAYRGTFYNFNLIYYHSEPVTQVDNRNIYSLSRGGFKYQSGRIGFASDGKLDGSEAKAY